MAAHSSVLAWRISGTGEPGGLPRISGTGEPGGLPSVASHRVGHDWSDLAAAAEWLECKYVGWAEDGYKFFVGWEMELIFLHWAHTGLAGWEVGHTGLQEGKTASLGFQNSRGQSTNGWVSSAFIMAAWNHRPLEEGLHQMSSSSANERKASRDEGTDLRGWKLWRIT